MCWYNVIVNYVINFENVYVIGKVYRLFVDKPFDIYLSIYI